MLFERFTEKARRVLVLAQTEARTLGHDFIGTEHILLGLVGEGEGVGAKALMSLGLSLPAVRDRVVAVKGSSGAAPAKNTGRQPFTPRAKKVLEFSLREALQLGHNYIGTEHILLGLVREDEGVAAEVLAGMGVSPSNVRDRVATMLNRYQTDHTLAVSPEVLDRLSGDMVRSAPRSLSIAMVEAMARAARLAASQPVTTGHVLLAILERDASQAAKALAALKVTKPAVEAKLAEIPVDTTSDAGPPQNTVEIKLGQTSTVIEDPELASALRTVTAQEIESALRDAVRRHRDPGGTPDEPGDA